MIQSSIIVAFGIVSLLYSVTGQSVLGQITLRHQDPLPVLLIHGYLEDKSVWARYEQLLQNDNIMFFPVTFHALSPSGPCDGLVKMTCDQCGSANQHAQELVQWVQLAKRVTGADKVNIVGHSKGGLDARVYLGNNLSNRDIANLIMIGTPNGGSPFAGPLTDPTDPCTPAVSDIRVGADDTLAHRNNNTQYYTIAGDWNPSIICDSTSDAAGFFFYFPQANDGIVPVWSVESEPYFNHLDQSNHPHNCHQDLMGDQEYQMTRDVLLGRR
jgi:triacylglycerol lipase